MPSRLVYLDNAATSWPKPPAVMAACLTHFGLKEKVVVGEISNMYTIAETMLRASKVINL